MSLSPVTRRRQQSVARWVRRLPGYRWASTSALPRVRRNPVLTDLAWRVFVPGRLAGEVEVPLHGGRYLEGPDVGMVPVVGVLALGLDDAAVATLVDEVARLQREVGSFRPVLLLDRPAFGAARRHGYVLEVLTPAGSWDGHDESWTRYVAARVGSVIDHYQLWHLLRADDGRLAPLDVALLAALRDRLPGTLRVRPVPRPPAGGSPAG